MKLKLVFLLILIFIMLIVATYAFWWREPANIITLQARTFAQLPGWHDAKTLSKSLLAFQTSCKVLLKQDPEQDVGSECLSFKAKDWRAVCTAALALNTDNIEANNNAMQFFQQWFVPLEFNSINIKSGLFTGYYSPILHGNLSKTAKYNVPIHSLPDDLLVVNLNKFSPEWKNKKIIGRLAGKALIPYYTRAEINNGAIAHQAAVLVWVDNDIDRSFLEIQGSGIVVLPNNTRINLGYAGENGAPYTSLAKLLIDKGVMTKENASMQAIKQYLTAYPEEAITISNQNKSFVFFQTLTDNVALGAQGVALTPGYSLAVDRKWIPLGAPLWLNTTVPNPNYKEQKPLQRLMVAQDTGGAIRGIIRGDLYWGSGKKATYIAGHMKNNGFYWVLLPTNIFTKLNKDGSLSIPFRSQ